MIHIRKINERLSDTGSSSVKFVFVTSEGEEYGNDEVIAKVVGGNGIRCSGRLSEYAASTGVVVFRLYSIIDRYSEIMGLIDDIQRSPDDFNTVCILVDSTEDDEVLFVEKLESHISKKGMRCTTIGVSRSDYNDLYDRAVRM